tara:strand:- start:54 stop:299 length:246 start_codon:yes stop_codon:yes gene_type:complete
VTKGIFCYVLKLLELVNLIGACMNIDKHLEELRRKHFELQEMIDYEQKQPAVSQIKLTTLKKQKLKLKDRIEKYTQALIYN